MKVLGPDPFTETVSLTDLHSWHDQGPVDYRIRSKAGAQSSSRQVNEPVSVGTLVGHLTTRALDPASITEAYFDYPSPQHPNSESTVLTPSDFALTGSQLPAVWDEDGAISYVRPLRTDDPNEVTRGVDYWQAEDGQPVVLNVQTVGHLLSPRIVASSLTVRKDKQVTFSVALPGAPDTTGWTFAWNFTNNTDSSVSAPARSWSGPGTYPVTVTLDAPDGSHGFARAVVTVTDPTQKPETSTGDPIGPSIGSGDPLNPSTGPVTSPNGADTGTGPQTGIAILPKLALQPVVGVAPVTGNITGLVLVNADGSVPGVVLTPRLPSDRAPVAARAERPESHGSWGWVLLLPAVLVLGAMVELRPWALRTPSAPKAQR